MKKSIKFLSVILFTALVGFLYTACDDGRNDQPPTGRVFMRSSSMISKNTRSVVSAHEIEFLIYSLFVEADDPNTPNGVGMWLLHHGGYGGSDWFDIASIKQFALDIHPNGVPYSNVILHLSGIRIGEDLYIPKSFDLYDGEVPMHMAPYDGSKEELKSISGHGGEFRIVAGDLDKLLPHPDAEGWCTAHAELAVFQTSL